jgi:hypothetical protein
VVAVAAQVVANEISSGDGSMGMLIVPLL